jgi:hypothetical protein
MSPQPQISYSPTRDELIRTLSDFIVDVEYCLCVQLSGLWTEGGGLGTGAKGGWGMVWGGGAGGGGGPGGEMCLLWGRMVSEVLVYVR